MANAPPTGLIGACLWLGSQSSEFDGVLSSLVECVSTIGNGEVVIDVKPCVRERKKKKRKKKKKIEKRKERQNGLQPIRVRKRGI